MEKAIGWLTWAFLFFFIGAAVGGCASVKVRRDLTDMNGKVLGSVEVDQNLATPEGAARIVASVGDLQRGDLADRADLRATQVAAASVEKGQPTTSNTSGGQVTSGYVGYDYNQYGNGYGYGGYNGFGQVMVPGASPEMMWIEAAGRQSYSLPPLGQTTSSAPNAASATTDGSYSGGLATCPQDRMPSTPAEQVACIRQDMNEVLRVHRP
ncbi:hypothetical protein HYV69_04170 [Candidatus Uhrbacteria bacterium]|nr:hypothetical protein [Candidatus Uhrbacteria bacterium]